MTVHVLVAEDDRNILEGLVDMLESEGYEVTPAANGQQALDLFGADRFNLVMLDVMMPEKSGYDVCRAIRAKDEDVPVIMLTAKGEEIDKILGLRLGADDYVTKPFSVRELLARVEAVLRRSKRRPAGQADPQPVPDRFTFGPAEVDALQYKVRIRDKTFDLSGRELRLLALFSAHPNEVLTRERLLNEVWGINYFGTTRTLDQHVAQLRKKIEPDPRRPRVITTVHGLGYRYESGE